MEEITNKATPHLWRRTTGFRFRWAGIEFLVCFVILYKELISRKLLQWKLVPALGLFAPARQSSKGFRRTRPYMVGIETQTHAKMGPWLNSLMEGPCVHTKPKQGESS